MTEEELAAIEARATAATREPWIVGDMYVPPACLSAVSVYGMGMEVAECQIDADAAFIAAARVDVPALVAEVRRLRAALAVEGEGGMGYLAQYVSEIKVGDRIRASDVAVLARVQQCILAADKHHQQARDAQASAS